MNFLFPTRISKNRNFIMRCFLHIPEAIVPPIPVMLCHSFRRSLCHFHGSQVIYNRLAIGKTTSKPFNSGNIRSRRYEVFVGLYFVQFDKYVLSQKKILTRLSKAYIHEVTVPRILVGLPIEDLRNCLEELADKIKICRRQARYFYNLRTDVEIRHSGLFLKTRLHFCAPKLF